MSLKYWMSKIESSMISESTVQENREYEDLENEYYYVIDTETGKVVDGPFDRVGEIPLRLMGYDGAHRVATGEDLKQGINEVAQTGTTNQVAAPGTQATPAQKMQIKPGLPQQAQAQQAQSTMTTQGGKTIAQGDPEALKKMNALLSAGGITMTDAQGKPIQEEVNGPHDHDFVEKSSRHERLRDLAKRMGDQEKYDFHDAEIKKLYGTDKNQESMNESMTNKQSIMEGTLEEILANHPHEHKQCQEGWGMDSSLFEALCDHYFKEGRIPRSVWHGAAEDLRKHVEECYAQDTTMVVGECADEIVQSIGNAIEEGEFTQHALDADERLKDFATEPKSSVMNKVGNAAKKVGKWLTGPSDEELRSGPLDEQSDLEQSLRNAAMRDLKDEMDENMYESKKLNEKDLGKHNNATTGFKALAKKAAKEYGSKAAGERVAGAVKAKMAKAGQLEEDEVEEGNEFTGNLAKAKAAGESEFTVDGKKYKVKEGTGRIHKGSYGTSYEAGDDVKKADTTRGRGRPKKDADADGEVKSYDTKSLGDIFGGGKKPSKEVGKLTVKNRIKTAADSDDEVMENWERQLSSMLNESITVVAPGEAIAPVGQKSPVPAQDESEPNDILSALKAMMQNAGTANTSNTDQVEPGSLDPRNDVEDGAAFTPLMAMPRGMGMSVDGDSHVHSIDVEPAAYDEVIGSLAAEDEGEADLDFIKRLLGSRTGGENAQLIVPATDYAQEDDGEEASMYSTEPFGHEVGALDENAGDPEGAEAAFAQDAEINSSLAQSYDADQNVNKDTNVTIDEEALDQPATMESEEATGTDMSRLMSKLDELLGMVGDDEAEVEVEIEKDEDSEEEAEEDCDDCGLTESKCECDHEEKVDESTDEYSIPESEELNEWANKPQSKEDEQFTTEMEFMTKLLSGGLNNMKRDQTTLPSTQVTAKQEASIADQMRKLAGIK